MSRITGYGIVCGKSITFDAARMDLTVPMVAERQRDRWNGVCTFAERVTLDYSPNGCPIYRYVTTGILAGGYN